MKKANSIILEGSAAGISFDKAFAEAIKNAPTPSPDMIQKFKLMDFIVETGGFNSKPMSYIKVRYE